MNVPQQLVRVFGRDYVLRSAGEVARSPDRRLMARLLSDADAALAACGMDLELARVALRRVVRLLMPTLPNAELHRLATIQYVQILEVSCLITRTQLSGILPAKAEVITP